MRRSSAFMLATTVLTGGAVLSFLAVAVAQDASGPSTSGGSLPYISGKEPDKASEERRDSPAKTQATSGSGSGERSPAAQAPAASGEARQEPAAAAKPPGGDKPRVIDLSQGRDKPAETPREAPAAVAEPKAEPTRREDAVPGPQRATAEPPPPAAKPERSASDEKPTEDAAKRAERKPAKPPTRKTTEATRKEHAGTPSARGLRRDAEPVDPYGRPLPRTATRDPREVDPDSRFARRAPQPGDNRYGRADDDDASDYYVYRPRRWRDTYPYVYAYPEYRTAPGALRPFSSSPRYYYVQPMGPGGGDNCHYHAYPGDGMRFHREIRCHWHEDAGDPSIRYVR